MNLRTHSTPTSAQFIRADLYAHSMNYLKLNIDLLHETPDSIMDLDRARSLRFLHDTNSAHGVFVDGDGKKHNTVQMIGQLGENLMLNPYFSLSTRGKRAVSSNLKLYGQGM